MTEERDGRDKPTLQQDLIPTTERTLKEQLTKVVSNYQRNKVIQHDIIIHSNQMGK